MDTITLFNVVNAGSVEASELTGRVTRTILVLVIAAVRTVSDPVTHPASVEAAGIGQALVLIRWTSAALRRLVATIRTVPGSVAQPVLTDTFSTGNTLKLG